MKKLIKLGIDQAVLANVLFVGMIIFAAFVAIPAIPVDRYPNIQFGEVEITTAYPGASPEEVELLVTKRVEDAMRDMRDIDWVKATSKNGLSSIRMKFVDDTEYEALYDELRLRVLSIQNQLPRVNGEPVQPNFTLVDVDEWLPVIQVNLISDDATAPLDQRALVLLGEELRSRLEEQPGIKRVVMLGDSEQQFDVVISPTLLERHRLTMRDVVQALQASGTSLPAGTLDSNLGERVVRVDSRYRAPEDIYTVVIRQDGDGNQITIADVMDTHDSGVVTVDGAVRVSVNGEPTVAAKVLKLTTASSLDVKQQVVDTVDEFLAAHKDDRVAAVYTEDNTIEIGDGMGVLTQSLVLSVILVMVLLFLFMANRSWKWNTGIAAFGAAAVLVAAVAPSSPLATVLIVVLTLLVLLLCRAAVLTVSGIVFSFLGALMLFWLTGYSLNEITLLGFVLVSGIIVDDAIVVLENIQRHREEGKPLVQAAIDATAEVAWPVISATFTTLAAFMPMLLMTGAVGEFFAMVPIAVSTALAISLIEALILLPLHAVESERILGRDKSLHRRSEENDGLPETGILAWVGRLYDRALRWNLRHPITVITGSFLLFFLAVGVLIYSAMAPRFGAPPILKAEFFPEDLSVLMLRVNAPAGTTLDQTDERIKEMTRYLEEQGRGSIWTASAITGMEMDTTYKPRFSNQVAMAMVKLPPKEARTFSDPRKHVAALRDDLEAKYEQDGWNIDFRPMPAGPPVGAPVNVRVSGVDEVQVQRLADDVLAWMHQEANEGLLQGVVELSDDREATNAVLTVKPDRKRTALFGLTDIEVQAFVAHSVEGAYVGEYRRHDGDIPVRVRLPEAEVADLSALLEVPIVSDASGRVLRFGDLGTFATTTEPADLVRRDFQRTVTISGQLAADAVIGATAVTAIVGDWYRENAPGYPGATIAFGGEAESTGKSYQSLAIAFLLAVLLIYAILAGQFRSYLQPFLIMSNIMFSFTGVVLVMAVLGLGAQALPEGMVRPERSLFTVNSFIAIIGLTGLVVNDAIVLIDFMNRRKREGLSAGEAALIAGRQRMRPIILTSLTTIAGLLPMAIGVPDFSITWGPFATSFIAGLTLSTVMTLLVVPVLYQTLERMRGGINSTMRSILPENVDEPLADNEPTSRSVGKLQPAPSK